MIKIKKEPGWETDLIDRACHPGGILTRDYFFFAPFFFAAFFFAAMDLFHLRSVLLWVDVDELPQLAQTRQSNFQLISINQRQSVTTFAFQQINFSVSVVLKMESGREKLRRIVWPKCVFKFQIAWKKLEKQRHGMEHASFLTMNLCEMLGEESAIVMPRLFSRVPPLLHTEWRRGVAGTRVVAGMLAGNERECFAPGFFCSHGRDARATIAAWAFRCSSLSR